MAVAFGCVAVPASDDFQDEAGDVPSSDGHAVAVVAALTEEERQGAPSSVARVAAVVLAEAEER